MKTLHGFLLLCGLVLLFTSSAQSDERVPDSARAADVSSFHVRIANLFQGDESGHVVFNDPRSLRVFRGEFTTHVNGQLNRSQIQLVRRAIEKYLEDPAPFSTDEKTASQFPESTEVHAGNKASMSYVHAARSPGQLLKLYDALVPALKGIEVDGDAAVRDYVIERLAAYRRPAGAEIDVASVEIIPNDDPPALFARLVADHGMNIDKKANYLIHLSGLKGTALGDKLFDFYQSQGRSLNRELLLGYSIEGGSMRAIPEWRTVIFEPLPKKTDYLIRKILDPASIQTLASAIGQKDINDEYSMNAWDWLAAHTDRLQFDAGSHKFHIIGENHDAKNDPKEKP